MHYSKKRRGKVITKLPEIKKEDLKSLENTRELDKAEIIINKVELDKKQEKEEPKKNKKVKNKKSEESKKNNDFLNTKDLEEILEKTKTTELVLSDIKKESNKNQLKQKEKEDEMDMEFLDDYKRRKKKRK